MAEAYQEEALLDDAELLDPNITDEALDAHIKELAARLVILAATISAGPRDYDQLVALDNVYDALDYAYRVEMARKIPPLSPEE